MNDSVRMLWYARQTRLRTTLVNAGRLTVAHPSQTPVAPDLDAAGRVIAAYQAAAPRSPPPQGVWANITKCVYAQLKDGLERGDVAAAADILECMFSSHLSMGLSMVGELPYLDSKATADFYLDWWLDGMLALNTYLAFLGEQPETGHTEVTAPEFDLLLERIIPGRSGPPVFPRVCDAWGPQIDGTLVPRTLWRHLHAAHVLRRHTAHLDNPRIVEVGGGFGGVAYQAHLLRPESQYAIYDLPLVNAVAGYFLIRALPDTIGLFGEATMPIMVLPDWAAFDDPGCDVVFNQDSLPEMPSHVALAYLELFDRIAQHGFYSDNQEHGYTTGGGRLPRLPDMESVMVRLGLRTRSRSWMRRGYVESWYTP